MTIISDGDIFQNALFGRNGQSGTIQAISDTAYVASNANGGYCSINGSIPPMQSGLGMPCTDFELTKTAASGATSLVFTVSATVLNFNGAPGPGFAMAANLDVTSQKSGPTFELWQGLLLGGYARGYGTTAVQNDWAVVASKDNSGSPAITVTPTFANTVVNSSGANTVTYTITVAFPAALDSVSTVAHLKLHVDQRYVFAFLVN